MSTLAIIIPCYNEANRLRNEAFIQFANTYPELEIYFVNDGSTDKTLSVLHQLQSNTTSIRIISSKENLGKGEAIRKAMLDMVNSYTYIGYLDADLSTSLEEFLSLYKKIAAWNKDIVFASRIKKADTLIKRSYARHIIGRTIATIIDKKFQLGCYDTQCGAKIFRSDVLIEAIKSPFLTKWFFDVELFLRIQKIHNRFNAAEVPLTAWINVNGSKLNVFSFPLIIKELYLLLFKYKK